MLTKDQEQKLQELLSKMTLAEKVGQLNHVGPSLVGTFELSLPELYNQFLSGKIDKEEFMVKMSQMKRDYHEEEVKAGKIGSYGGLCGREDVRRIQKIAVEESRLGIPVIFGHDVIHGYRTGFPIPLAEACAFDDEMWEKGARLAALEASYDGINMTYSPMVDVSKDARWGRIAESAGEDTLMNCRYGAAKVRGYQTEDPSNDTAIAACAKHFCAYGYSEGGRDYNRVEISEERLREEVLPSFKACVDEGLLSIMPSFNDINGVPSSVNKWLLRDVLRGEFGFKGLAISDANAIQECIAHGVCEDKADAAKKSLEAGMNIDMSSDSFSENLERLVEEGKVSMKDIDLAVEEVLRVKFELGLFENPYKGGEDRDNAFLNEETRAFARKMAQKSIVLLKNENVLPLNNNVKLAVLGKYADNAGEMRGTWAINVLPEDCISLMAGLNNRGANATYYENIDDVRDEEVILLTLGESSMESGEAASKASIELCDEDKALFEKALETGKKVVVVLFNGRPMVISRLKEKADGIIEAWQLGVEGGNAIADVLYGDVNPSGKLTASFPNATGECPCYYGQKPTGRPATEFKFTSKYIDIPTTHVYNFGYGLSYTTFEYSNMAVERCESSYKISVDVKNTGDRCGDEVVQCYYSDPVALRTRPSKKLVDYKKITLESGETKTVCFDVPFEKLGYYINGNEFIVENGKYVLMVGGSSDDVLTEEVVL